MSVNLISYLRNWGASLISSNKSFFGAQALPSGSTIQTVLNGAQNYTAPEDGYVCLADNSNGYHRISINAGLMVSSITTTDGAGWGSGWFPVKKGQLIGIRSVASTAEIRFVELMGGG